MAVTGTVGAPAVLLWAAGVFWTLGYDTIYGHQDREGDRRIGVKSTALLFGRATPWWVAAFDPWLPRPAGRRHGTHRAFSVHLYLGALTEQVRPDPDEITDVVFVDPPEPAERLAQDLFPARFRTVLQAAHHTVEDATGASWLDLFHLDSSIGSGAVAPPCPVRTANAPPR
ncbi:UbiA family prenyltransferase [Actinoplanes sp. TRM 88003]|uniref:UbiA family prenyltransferase n=1 Tax=Paractinoplanes aksuensis TaxID=2939490 RepID=A0ABT1DX85_9ACTN|nr:UbiA family prenyltransferase [Actinoplanes aksuensis]